MSDRKTPSDLMNPTQPVEGEWHIGRMRSIDVIPAHWSIARLTDYARLESGHTPSRRNPEYWDGNIQWLSLNDTAQLDKHRVHETANTITPAGIDNSSARLLPPETVAFSRTATVGKAVLLGQEMATSQDFACYVCGDQVHPPFLMQLFRAMQDAWNALMGGSTHQTIYMPDFRKLQIPLPPLPEQKKIAAILASVDEAIEATEAVIEQTRRVKKGLLQELLTRGIGHTEFKKTAIGEIPKGWEVQKLRTLLAEPTRNGYSPVCLDEETGKWVLGLGALTPDGLDIREIKAAPLDDAKVDSAMLKVGDVLVSRSNTVERVAYAAIYKGEVENCAYPDLMIRARPDRSRLHPEFLTAHLWTTYARRYFQGAAAGTSGSMVKITGSVLNNLRVPVPSLEEQREIIGRLESIDSAVGVNREFLYELQELKKGLLQDLLTGKVRVNVDEAVGEVEEAVEALAE
jgi:type I restriction enzyme S subunit